MKNDTWRTLLTDDFETDKYLYHYTTVTKLIKILSSQELRFSSLNQTNDTTESKTKIRFLEDDEKENIDNEQARIINQYITQRNKNVCLLCFSKDVKLKPTEKERIKQLYADPDRDIFFDVTGRGFALPRMWAQYAGNHEGACLVIDKKELEKRIKNDVANFQQGSVQYKGAFSPYFIGKKDADSIFTKIKNEANGQMVLVKLMETNSAFIRHNYFTKQKDWESEREYRYIALTDNEASNHQKVSGLFTFLKGIVLGEKIDPAFEKAIRMMVGKVCEVKKIIFCTTLSYLE
jgi:hypothetical protein